MARIKPLHTYLITEAYLLDIHTRGFLHQGLLDIAIASLYKLLSCDHLYHGGRLLDRA